MNGGFFDVRKTSLQLTPHITTIWTKLSL